MPNYAHGKIYKLTSNVSGKIYVGSTTQTLCKRKAGHVSDYRRFHAGKCRNVTSFNILKDGDFSIVLLEKYPCEDKSQLEDREKYYVKSLDCVNKVVPRRTRQEYNDDNKEKNKQYYQDHKKEIKQKHENNKIAIQIKRKERYENKKPILLEQKKHYYQRHKEEINEKRSQKIMCECSGKYTAQHKARHERTQRHQAYLRSLI